MHIRGLPLFIGFMAMAAAQEQAAPDAYRVAESAYAALRVRDYFRAIEGFRAYLRLMPGTANVHKDLAYTLLKIGENAAARDEFAEAVRLDQNDHASALEYAFLCNETKRQAEARRVFDRLRREAEGRQRETATQAFENIDRTLRDGIAQWRAALRLSPENFSAHEELARLAELRDELGLAAEHYAHASRLRPERYALLLDLARVQMALGSPREAAVTYQRAAQSEDPRVAETAREHLPNGASVEIAMLAEPRKVSAKQLGVKSLEKSFLADALRYLTQAREEDPDDLEIALKLGWTHNQLGQDELAADFFRLAQKSPEPKIAQEARRAWLNLKPGIAKIRLITWLFPLYSSRWESAFLYGQAKLEFRVPKWKLRPYLSARVVGDVGKVRNDRSRPDAPVAPMGPMSLSERAIIPAIGLARQFKRGIYLWGEAGQAISYTANSPAGRMVPDYRGGVSYSKGWGQHLTSESGGFFHELEADAVFVSRFANNVVYVAQNRTGYTTPPVERFGGFQAQLMAHWNANADRGKQYWANFLETGPGVRARFRWMPSSLFLGAQYLYGWYTVKEGNPRAPQYRDLRLGLWYAFCW